MLGKKLKELRGTRTQQEIANAIGISRARYSHYENDLREPDFDTLKQLAEFHNVQIDYLLGLTDNANLTAVESTLQKHAEKDNKTIDELIDHLMDKIINEQKLEIDQSNREQVKNMIMSVSKLSKEDFEAFHTLWDIMVKKHEKDDTEK